jgi:DNA-directed RNA polymerase subunit omega
MIDLLKDLMNVIPLSEQSDKVDARYSSETCLKHIANPFQLVLVAALRARQLAQGQMPLIVQTEHQKAEDKYSVTALREIAEGKVGLEILKKIKLNGQR